VNISLLAGSKPKMSRKSTIVHFLPEQIAASQEEPFLAIPLLGLKGCTPISSDNSRYEINLGQQDHGSGSVVWDLTIENASEMDPEAKRSVPVEYKIYTVNKDDENWLVCLCWIFLFTL
jgi:hypothetical protein